MYRIKTLNKISSAGLDLLDQTRHAVGAGEISHCEAGVDQVQCDGHGFVGSQGLMEATIDGSE